MGVTVLNVKALEGLSCGFLCDCENRWIVRSSNLVLACMMNSWPSKLSSAKSNFSQLFFLDSPGRMTGRRLRQL